MAIFDINNDDIKNLDEVGLPKLVYQIMYYEVAKLNLLNQGLQISLNTKTGDGGSDGEFNNFNKPIPEYHQFLPNKNIVFQFKSAEIGDKAWFKNEILNNDKSDLKPKLKELIDSDYAYLLITNKTDLPAIKFDEKEKVLQEVFSDAGYENVFVKIIGLAKLSEWANSIPQIYLNRNRHTKYFELFDNYEYEIKQYSYDIEYVNDEKREESISQIRDEINTTLSQRKSSFIRVEGFSGIGKTRFIYESLNDENYKKFVLYVQSYNDDILGDLITFCKMIPENSQELIIFVIDECPYDEHTQICRRLKKYQNLVIITINQILSQQDIVNCRDEKRILLEGLDEVRTVKLIQNTNPLLDDDIAKKIAYYTEGYPRLAYFMASYYDIGKGDIDNPEIKSELLNHILNSITTSPDDIKILQAISIFKMFPNTDDFKTYKSIIFSHFNIDIASATIAINELIKKGIIRQAGRFLYISPRPVSIYLFNIFLEIYDYDFIDELFQKLNHEGLMNGFFEKLQGIKFDSSQHKELLHQILSKLTYEQINKGLGAKIFHSLCLKDREYSICILNKMLDNKSKDDLLKLEDGRRYLIHSLEDMISYKDTFEDSAKILFLFARAENESWSNNSKGVFNDSFQWILSGTEVNIVDRITLLKELYQEYTDNDDRVILLDALKNAYPKHNYMATHKNYATVPENIPEHYEPKTQNEINRYFEKLKEMIIFVYEESSNKLQSKVINDLAFSLRTMMNYKQINIWILDFIEKALIQNNHLKTLVFEQISLVVKYDKDEKLSKEILDKLKEVHNKFIHSENIDDTKELFFKTDKYRYNSEENFNNHCKLIAHDIFESKNFDILIDKNTSNVFDIGKELALIDKENVLYEDIINLISKLNKDSNIRFITAYIFNNKMGDESNYQVLFDEIYHKLNDKSLMFEFIYSSFRKNKIIIEYLYMLLEKKEIDSSLLENLTYGFWLRKFDKSESVEFIDKINSIIDNKCDSFDLCMQYLHSSKDKELIERYTIYYIENNIFTCITKHRITHYIDEMIDYYFSNNLELPGSTLLKVWEAILVEFDTDGKFEDRGFQAIYKIIKRYPDFFWDKVKNKLDELKPTAYPLYTRFVNFMQGGYMSRWFNHSIFSYIDSDKVIKWLKITKYEKAKYIVADSFNIDFESDNLPDIVINILKEFPNDKKLYGGIHCGSESWSGSYVPVANQKISNIDTMLELYKDNSSVVDFLKWAKKYFENRRDGEQVRDEERYLH
ncbi:MAG: hypothetical protein U9R16_03145 [Campylobacterota bacterium]|nr:hypothetical protein [Campylobacterota bacterium]